MNGQEDFFSIKHKRLLNIATWAKYLAGIILVFYLLSALGEVFQFQHTANFNTTINNQSRQSLTGILNSNLFDTFVLITDIATTILKGFIYYLVLKGFYLGLNMIVETDINYRDQKQQGGT